MHHTPRQTAPDDLWTRSCSHDGAHKARFHREATKRLKQLAQHLGFSAGSFDICSNKAGPAVSGEITLHHDRLYVQISQGFILGGIMFRSCNGRRDYTGGNNHFAPLQLLNDPGRLARTIRQTIDLA